MSPDVVVAIDRWVNTNQHYPSLPSKTIDWLILAAGQPDNMDISKNIDCSGIDTNEVIDTVLLLPLS